MNIEHLRALRDREQLLDELIAACASELTMALLASNRVVALCQRGCTAEATVYAETACEAGLITEAHLETALVLIEDYDAGRRPQLQTTEVVL